jgi:hypothetical protein
MIMKKMMLLALLVSMSIPSAALALTEGVDRGVMISGSRAGTASFVYTRDFDGPTGFCAYSMFWASPYGAARPAEGAVRELKMLGQTSCLDNRLSNLVTSVTSVPGGWGFDQYGLVGHVSLVLGERDVAPTLTGLAVFEAFPFLAQAITIE